MELVLLAVAAYLGAKAAIGIGRTVTSSAHAKSQKRLAVRQRQDQLRRQRIELDRRRREQQRRLHFLYSRLKQSLLSLNSAPDFRRAAACAAQAAPLAAVHRQQLFALFRRKLLAHFIGRHRAGENQETLIQSLQSLIQHLGISGFEAEYIVGEATRCLNRPTPTTPPPSFQDRMAALTREHQQRIHSIDSMAHLDDETRERLRETELNRFRTAVLSLADRGGDIPPTADE